MEKPARGASKGLFKAEDMLAEVTWRTTLAATSLAELDSLLDKIEKRVPSDRPQAVQVTRSNGDSLTIVLGSQIGSILNYIADSGDPPYFVSVGDPQAKGIFTYYVAEDHHSEALLRHVVAHIVARDAVREFVICPQGLPQSIAWEEI